MDKTFFINKYKNDQITCDDISKIATGQGDNYTTGCLLDSFGLLGLFPLFNMINSIVNSYKKELKNMDLKEFNGNLIIDTGLNNMGKKI